MPNSKLKKYISKRINQPTVILSFRIILDNTIQHGVGSKMTKVEIERVFNSENAYYGIQTFRRDYVMRQSGNPNNAIDEQDQCFFIRDEFLRGVDIDEMIAISKNIKDHFDEIYVKRKQTLDSIENAKNLAVDERYTFIVKMLLEKETERRGQSFEVTSFAILKTYFENRGFLLNRYSTIYANDGGVDFAAQNAIYQVAGVLNKKKFDEDLAKAPEAKRIMVYKRLVSSFDEEMFNHRLISDHLGPEDIVDHLNYMKKKNGDRNTMAILNTMLYEFQREYYYNATPEDDE